MVVLDASALLALLFRETGHERVAAALPQACMSTVNLNEVLTRFARLGRDSGRIAAELMTSPIEWFPYSVGHAALAASMEPTTRKSGLSLGDRACLALAIEQGWKALTTDRAWGRLPLAVEIEIIR